MTRQVLNGDFAGAERFLHFNTLNRDILDFHNNGASLERGLIGSRYVVCRHVNTHVQRHWLGCTAVHTLHKYRLPQDEGIIRRFNIAVLKLVQNGQF